MGKVSIPIILNEEPLPLISCPTCKENYIHFEKPRLISGFDNYCASKNYGWGGRGSLIVIPMYCEFCCGEPIQENQKFFFCIGFHKGNTSVWIYEPSKEESKFLNPNIEFSER